MSNYQRRREGEGAAPRSPPAEGKARTNSWRTHWNGQSVNAYTRTRYTHTHTLSRQHEALNETKRKGGVKWAKEGGGWSGGMGEGVARARCRSILYMHTYVCMYTCTIFPLYTQKNMFVIFLVYTQTQ